MTQRPYPSASVLHKQWVELENEQHELAIAIDAARARGVDLASMRERQARRLLDINLLVSEIRNAQATTAEDFLALLDVALEHELDLACDIAFYGPVLWRAGRRNSNLIRSEGGYRCRANTSS